MCISSSTWNFINNQWHHPISFGEDDAVCCLKLAEIGVNVLHKTMVAVAALVALIATPILLLIDLCCMPFCGEKTVEALTILDFYQGGRNDRGVTLEEIWGWDDSRLESQHDFIQWLFPLTTQGVNPTAPLTDNTVMSAFKADKTLQDKMVRSFDVMLNFYGFSRSSNTIQIGANFDDQAQNWLNPGNHNYRRITRILTSLKLHGLGHYAKAFMKALQQVYQDHSDQIGSQTFSIWQSASK